MMNQIHVGDRLTQTDIVTPVASLWVIQMTHRIIQWTNLLKWFLQKTRPIRFETDLLKNDSCKLHGKSLNHSVKWFDRKQFLHWTRRIQRQIGSKRVQFLQRIETCDCLSGWVMESIKETIHLKKLSSRKKGKQQPMMSSLNHLFNPFIGLVYLKGCKLNTL